jgi:PEP-CTERM motif
MIKKLAVYGVFVVALLNASAAFAYVIDGNLSDWGVTPFTDWTPGATADYVVENNTNRAPSDPFKEKFDIEAMYFDDDADYLYFGIVSSNKYQNNWAGEDLAIDLNNDGVFEYGANVANVKAAPTAGGPIYGRTKGIYEVNSWNYMRGIEYKIKTGTHIGTYDIYNRYLGKIEPGVPRHFAGTYILEGRISKLLFGPIACGQAIRLQFARVTCIKDWIDLQGFCNGNCPGPNGVVPEPATLLLLGGGILGLFGSRKKKRSL